jgi:hypothetical protein
MSRQIQSHYADTLGGQVSLELFPVGRGQT